MDKEELKRLVRDTFGPEHDEEFDEVFDNFIGKFGDLKDTENNPLLWNPSEREEKGLSLEDRVKYLELELELMRAGIAKVMKSVEDVTMRQEIAELRVTNPQAAALLEKLQKLDPNGDKSFASGIPVTIPPDELLPTVNGPIRADQVPGYRNEPGWTPDPVWAADNCACPVHEAMRKEKGGSSGPTGMYL